MGLLVALVLVVQCGYSTGYAASYSYAAPTAYYNAVSYVPYVQAVKFVAVEPSYNDLYPSLVAGELRAARRYEAMEKQAATMERLEAALERMSAPAPAPPRASARVDYEYRAASYAPPGPSGQYEAPPAYSAPPVPAKAPPPVPAKAPPPAYSVPQVPAKAPPPAYSVPQVPAKAPPTYSVPQVPAKAPPTYSVPQVPSKAPAAYSMPQGSGESPGSFGDVAPPSAPDLPDPAVATAADGLAVLGMRCAGCHTRGSLRGNSFPIFVAPGRINPSLTAAQQAEMIARVEAGDMPPTGPLPPDEVDAIRRHLASRGAAVASR